MDFIAECHPRTFRDPVENPDGFVAEVRRSSRHLNIPNGHTHSMPIKANSPKHDDTDRALNEVLFNKSNSRDKMANVMHTTIVKLINTLLNGYTVTSIKGSINVTVAENEHPICLEFNQDYFQSLKSPNYFFRPECSDLFCGDRVRGSDTMEISSARSPMTADVMSYPEESDWVGKYSPPYYNRDIPSAAPSSVGTIDELDNVIPTCDVKEENTEGDSKNQNYRRKSGDSEKSDSEGESGYCSAERESISDEGGEEMMDSSNVQWDARKDDHKRQCPREICEENDLNEPQLVIDLSSACDENVIRKIDEQEVISPTEMKSDKLDEEVNTDETNTEIQATSSVTDVDNPMDLSGDCLVNVNAQGSAESELQKTVFVESSKVMCKKCATMLPDIGSYEEHALQKHQLYACSTCFKDFSSKNNLKRHVRIHTGSRPYKCKQCEMSFARKDDLKGHTLKHDFNKPFRCSLCGKGYTDRACVKNHMSKEHCSRLMKICPECGESFDREEAFLEHKKTHPSLQQFACETCPFIGTNHLMALKHKLLHSYKLFSCKPCGACYADPFGYTSHVRRHKKNKEYCSYVCCFCDVTLPTYDQFVRHEYSHAQGKLHECNVCSMQFKNKTSMQEHSLAHADSASTNELEKEAQNKDSDDMDFNADEGAISLPTLKSPDQPSNRPAGQETTVANIATYNTDSDEGRLLDLTVKPKLGGKSYLQASTGIESTKLDIVSDVSSQRTPSPSHYSVSRNGSATTDTRAVPEQEKSFQYRGLEDKTNAKVEEEFQVVWQSPMYNKEPPVNQRMHNRVTRFESIPNLSSLNANYGETNLETPRPGRDGQRLGSNSHRYSPYSKMVDLAKKFMAARGSLFTTQRQKESGNSQSGAELRPEPTLPARQRSPTHAMSSTVAESHHNTNVIDLKAVPSNVIIGLSGKPYIPTINSEEPTKRRSEKTKKEFHEQEAVPSSTTDSDAVGMKSFPGYNGQDCKSHSSEKVKRILHDCDICNTRFNSFCQLENHSVVSHSRYLCEFCSKGFTARANRDRHVRYHTGERPYKCELCPSAFFRGDDLKYHRTTRHPLEQISCNRCEATFTWRKDLERHWRHSKCVGYTKG